MPFKNFVTQLFQADPRSDPEDSAAFEHAEKVRVEQEKQTFPLQTLRGGKLPSDTKVEKVGWEKAPANFDSWVDVYEGPSGIGFVVNYEINKAGKLYRKAINNGPETHREQDWTEVVESEGINVPR